jgi:hypothetical protein
LIEPDGISVIVSPATRYTAPPSGFVMEKGGKPY